MIASFSEQIVERPDLLQQFKNSYPSIQRIMSQKMYWVESQATLDTHTQKKIEHILLSPRKKNHQPFTVTQKANTHCFQVAYRKAIRDPEYTAIEKMLELNKLKENIQAIKGCNIYFIDGELEETEDLVRTELMNPQLQVLHPIDHSPDTLSADTIAEKNQILTGFNEMSTEELLQLSLDKSLYMEEHYLLETQRQFRDVYQRDPSEAELEYLAQRTSDHCFHTTWKSLGLFNKLKKSTASIVSKRDDILSVFIDNSGVMQADDKQAFLIKGETHNSPTALAPVGGVETMHGGCLRDIIGTGTGGFPTMASQVFIIGNKSKQEMKQTLEVDSFLDPLIILKGMIQGVQNYGNPMGVPNFGGRIFRHPQFFGKPLALGICLGTTPPEHAKKGTPEVGDIALLIGNRTGRDGIHGATASSAANDTNTQQKEGTTVQIGDPYTERLIMEATPAFRHLIRAYGDLGAGGIASCFGEMAEGVGIEIDLTHLPLKYDGLAGWEKLESESQERMGIAVSPENLSELKQLLDDYEVPYFELGYFTGDQKLRVKNHDEYIVDIDYNWLESFPVPQKTVEAYSIPTSTISLKNTVDIHEGILKNTTKVLSLPELSDQSMFINRWDSTVQGRSLREAIDPMTHMPYDQGIVVPSSTSDSTQVLSLTVNPWWSGNPHNMALACCIGAVSKQISAGVKRNKIALCDNFYTPKSQKKIDFELTQMVDAITQSAEKLGTPLISGKDSSSGTTQFLTKEGKKHTMEVSPTLCISAVGAGKVTHVIPKSLQRAGNTLVFIPAGISNDSSANPLLTSTERSTAFNYQVNWEEYITTLNSLETLIKNKTIKSISVVDDGGIVHRLFEMMLGASSRKLGIDLHLQAESRLKNIEFLSNTFTGAFIVEVENTQIVEHLNPIVLGTINNKGNLELGPETLDLSELKAQWKTYWPQTLGVSPLADLTDIQKKTPSLSIKASGSSSVTVNILYYPGINCHREMLDVWEQLGCKSKLINLSDTSVVFNNADIIVFPGGFADGDYLGAAKVWYEHMKTYFWDQIEDLKQGEKPVLGICNGFQLMSRAGFFGEGVSLEKNNSGVFESRWLPVSIEKTSSLWLKGLEGKELIIPVAHSEGKFVIDFDVKSEQTQVAMRYSHSHYPFNPNGSHDNIAGIISGKDGQFFGAMPHPERALFSWQKNQDGLMLFKQILENL